MRRGFKTWAEQEAIRCRGLVGVAEYAPLDCRKLANVLGVQILTPQDLGMEPRHLGQLLQHDSGSWSGVTVITRHRDKVIVVNPTNSSARQASDLAHELAHILCGHTSSGKQLMPGIGFPLRPFDEEQEAEAVWLGGCLLLPRRALVYALSRSSEDQVLAQYGVSADLLRYRKNVTGVAKQLQASPGRRTRPQRT